MTPTAVSCSQTAATPVACSRSISQYIASCACPIHCPLDFSTASSALSARWNTGAVSAAGSRGSGNERLAGVNPTRVDIDVCSMGATCEYGQSLRMSSSSHLAHEAQFVEPRFCIHKTVKLDPHGRRKIHSDAHLHRRACTKEHDMYYIWGENKSVEDKNIDVCALGGAEAAILELGNDGSDQRLANGFRTTLEIAGLLGDFFLERDVLNVRTEDVPTVAQLLLREPDGPRDWAVS